MDPNVRQQIAGEKIRPLYITHVDRIGNYLKICGQPNPSAVNIVRTKMLQLLPSCFVANGAHHQAIVQPGTLCLYRHSKGAAPGDCDVMRVQIVSVVPHSNSLQVEVDFIDYGYTATVTNHELLFTQQSEMLRNVPALCASYIVLNIACDWKQHHLDEIARLVQHQTLDISIEGEFNEYKFITLIWKEYNFAEYLVHHKHIGAPIAAHLLRTNFVKFINEQESQVGNKARSNAIGATGPSSYANNNNNNYFANHNNNNNLAGESPSKYNGGVAQARDQVTVQRSLAARLQQHQYPHLPLPLVAVPMPTNIVMQPRMPQNLVHLRTMMQDIHSRNNRVPFTGLPYNGMPVMPSAPVKLNTYNARYHDPSNIAAYRSVAAAQHDMPAEVSVTPSRRTAPATFKSNSLSVGHTYEVFISYVENGPCLFSVHLASAQDELTEMMNRIEHIELRQFTEKPMLGTACIARYSEDGQLYRALITSIQPMACRVTYIDYGNVELVQFRNLYEIPSEFLVANAYAIRFTLSGYKELEPIDESLKKAFEDLVKYKNFKLKVMPLEGPPLVPYCELYMQEKNMLDVLKEIQKCRLGYANAEPLKNNEIVEIRYIVSPKNFYVQPVSKIAEFDKLMDDMYAYYNTNQVVPQHLPLGTPCIVKFEKDWYRAEVMRADDTAIIVRHVDFGYERKVTRNLLSNIAEKHLKLPRQAVQCCLKGFENNELSKELATTQFEMLAEESNRSRRAFTVKVFKIHPDGVNLVNLCTRDLNVMKKLYKLSMPFEEYLSLEKDEFKGGHNHIKATTSAPDTGSYKASSIASSSLDEVPRTGSNKGNILNSTTLLSEERMQQQQNVNKQQTSPQRASKQQQQQSPAQQARHSNNNNTSQSSFSTEWDKISSASSMDNRDSRSSSSEFKQNKQRQQRHGKNNPNLNVSNSSSDRRSTGSGGSASGGAAPNNKQRNGAAGPPARQPTDNSDGKRRDNRESAASNTPPQQRGARPQNAPQGYSQQRKKQPAALVASRPCEGNSAEARQDLAEQQVPAAAAEEYVPLNRPFPCQPIETPVREPVIISWWISPHQFYTHLKSRLAAFEAFMVDLQRFYKHKSAQPLQLKVGSHVVARYRKENTVYRARILACNQMLRKYKVHFVDVGNQYTVTSEDIWPVEKRFADFACMAHLCSFRGIVSNYDHLYVIDRMEKYLPAGAALVCEYIECEQDMYYVNVKVNGHSLQHTLKADELITEVCPELRLDLLAGQQIRARITAIKDMLNFKIKIEGWDERVQFLCSYDDVRYVKSNPDTGLKFKSFYEGKSCVVNIKDVNDNKVILLRPLLPLLKADIPTYVCSYPIALTKFDARVVHVASAYRLYVHMATHEEQITQLLNDMYAQYENGGDALDEYEIGQLCAANGTDGNWYRARIATSGGNSSATVEVKYIDYGNAEELKRTALKRLEPKFYVDKSCYAVEINLPLRLKDQHPKGKAKSKPTDEAAAKVVQEINDLTFDQLVAVTVLMVRQNRLIADISVSDQVASSLVDILKEKQLIKARDVEYMRKQLDKEQPNMLEYIEMVDLTLEDEEVVVKPAKTAAKPASPKKNKTPAEIDPSTAAIADKLVVVPKTSKVIATETVEAPAHKDVMAKAADATATGEPMPSVAAQPPEPRQEEAQEIVVDPYADMEHAVLSHCDSPGQFFLHLQEKVDDLHKMEEDLQLIAGSLQPLLEVKKGDHCISFYSVKKQWYRASIMDAELLVLKFIDYGNTDCVSDTTDLKKMMTFGDVEPYCLPCALPIRPNGTADWVDAANAIFNDSYNKLLHFEYITRGGERNYINLFIDGVNVADKLIEIGLAKPLATVTSGENCYISHVNNLSDFFIQYEKDSKALELIEIHLGNNGKFPKLAKFERSKIVAALFPDDEMWYRAQLLREVPQKGYEVLFIDYGNTSISPECREISAEIATVPPLSKKCALELPDQCAAWTEAAEKQFAEIAGSGETIYTVELRQPAAHHAVVQLLIDGHNIGDDLAPLCEPKPEESSDLNVSYGASTIHSSIYESGVLHDAVVSHVNSPWDFYVHFNKDALRLEDMTATLNTLAMDRLVNPDAGQICAALFSEDGAFYRARILETLSGSDAARQQQSRVLFIDFGNEAVSDDVRALPQDLQQLQAFSKHCQLESPSNQVAKHLMLAATTFKALIKGCAGAIKVDLVDVAAEPAVVKLYTLNTGDNVHEKLCKLLSTGATTAACLISYAESPTHFYIQLKSDMPKMEQISKALHTANVSAWPALKMPMLDHVCIVYANEDDRYYRGRVEKILADTDCYEIYLIDYGNCIVATQLYELPAALLEIPALALRCRLNAVPDAPAAVLENIFTALLDAHFGEIFELEADILEAETRVHTVTLQANYKDLAEQLAAAVESGAAPVETQATLHDCAIIHTNSPASFYIQLAADVSAVEKITEELLDAERDFASFADLHLGAVCAAQFPDDLAFYRAEIVQVLGDDRGEPGMCEVHYLDFGNNAVTNEFRQLPEHLRTAQRYSKHCALETMCDTAHFQALVDAHFSETFQVEIVKTTADQLHICRLFHQTKNVATEVTKLLKEATANPSSGANSMDDTNGR